MSRLKENTLRLLLVFLIALVAVVIVVRISEVSENLAVIAESDKAIVEGNEESSENENEFLYSVLANYEENVAVHVASTKVLKYFEEGLELTIPYKYENENTLLFHLNNVSFSLTEIDKENYRLLNESTKEEIILR